MASPTLCLAWPRRLFGAALQTGGFPVAHSHGSRSPSLSLTCLLSEAPLSSTLTHPAAFPPTQPPHLVVPRPSLTPLGRPQMPAYPPATSLETCLHGAEVTGPRKYRVPHKSACSPTPAMATHKCPPIPSPHRRITNSLGVCLGLAELRASVSLSVNKDSPSSSRQGHGQRPRKAWGHSPSAREPLCAPGPPLGLSSL